MVGLAARAGPDPYAVPAARVYAGSQYAEAWASGAYTTDPGLALDVVVRAAAPAGTIRDRDRPFIRAVRG